MGFIRLFVFRGEPTDVDLLLLKKETNIGLQR